MDESLELRYVDAMRHISHEQVLTKGTVLSPSMIYYLMDGVCSLLCSSSEGNEYSFIYFKPHMLLNFLPTVARHGVYGNITEKRVHRLRHLIMTKTTCTVLCTPGEVFLRHMEQNIYLNQLLVRSLTENWINLLVLSTGITSEPVSIRVCRLVVDNLPAAQPYRIPRFLTHAEIAAHLSMHTITVTKVFRALRELGIVEKDGNAHIVVDLPGMLAICEGEVVLSY